MTPKEFDLNVRQVLTLVDQYYLFLERPRKARHYLQHPELVELVRTTNGYSCRILDSDRDALDGEHTFIALTLEYPTEDQAFEIMRSYLRDMSRFEEDLANKSETSPT